MLLCTLWCTGRPPTQSDLVPGVTSALGGKPCCRFARLAGSFHVGRAAAATSCKRRGGAWSRARSWAGVQPGETKAGGMSGPCASHVLAR